MPTKYIFVTGGVVSSIGKGITTASLGRLLKSRGYKVSIQKFDPYINANPGMMSPYQHGEVFVTDDGTEADLDLGHYERFIDENLTGFSTVTTGKIYWHVLQRERRGDYQGGTIQVVPHITNEIKTCIHALEKAGNPDIIIAEIGGTVGDIEGLPYLEAIRQFRLDVGAENTAFIHVTLLPFISASGELKTKPTQHSVKELLSIGIQPDILVVRSEHEVSEDLKEKIALFCNVYKDCVIPNPDCATLYEVPLLLEREGLDKVVLERLHLSDSKPDLTEWRTMVGRILNPARRVTIALVGDFVELKDAYLSVSEALLHAGIDNDARVEVKYIQSEDLNEGNADAALADADGILVPGVFSNKGIDGKLAAIKYARERGRPFFGICFGMQLAVIEFARNVLGIENAASMQMEPEARELVIYQPPGLRDGANQEHAARLGLYGCALTPDTHAAQAYGLRHVSERHQHGYELNNAYVERLCKAGMQVAGVNEEKNLVEIIEIPSHPWFVGVQFHPEFRSRPNRPHPLFSAYINAALDGIETEH